MGLSIMTTKKLQVYNDGFFKDATLLKITVSEDITDMTVMFNDFSTTTIEDIFGIGGDFWRYKEKCCEQCIYCSSEGGDSVPFGMCNCATPEYYICNCEYVSEEDPYDELNGGSLCKYYKNNGKDILIPKEEVYNVCLKKDWLNLNEDSCSNFTKDVFYKLLEGISDIDSLSSIICSLSKDISKDTVLMELASSLNV